MDKKSKTDIVAEVSAKPDLTSEEIQKLADEASVSTTTIVKRLARLPVKAKAADRADAVLRKHGLLPYGTYGTPVEIIQAEPSEDTNAFAQAKAAMGPGVAKTKGKMPISEHRVREVRAMLSLGLACIKREHECTGFYDVSYQELTEIIDEYIRWKGEASKLQHMIDNDK